MAKINATKFSIKEEDTNIFPLKFTHLFSAFVTLILGWFLGILVFTAELLKQKY